MNTKFFVVGLTCGLTLCGFAYAATFKAELKAETLTIYSTTTKAEKRCTAVVLFSYVDKSGMRKNGTHQCKDQPVPVGSDLEMCKVRDAALAQARLESPVTAECE